MADILERLTRNLSDRYLIERELARGGFATVFLAKDARHDREVAIKVLHPELSASIGADRFEREIKLAAKLQHPNILGLYDSGSADGLLYYVMPFIKGESLRDRLDREGQLPIDDAVQVTLEVAEALGYAHAAGIVHRDIKPENVLISAGHALVADFGIARAASKGGAQKLTQTGMAVGTPVYMSPEQAVGNAVGPTSDLYSLGCMLYEMLAGEPPFTAKNAQALMARHSMEAVPSVRIVRNTVPEEVEDAIFAAMAKVPADRPQTAAQFMEMLGLPMGATASRRTSIRHTASRRVPMGPHRMLEQEAPSWWRKPWVLGAAAVLVLGAGLAAWRLGVSGGTAPAEAGGLDPHRIAVLYFEDLSKDKQLGFLADGLTEALIGTLGQVQGLSVVSKGGVEDFRDASVAPDSISRALTAGTLVRGSIEPAGTKLQVNVRLVDGNSGVDFDRISINQPSADFLAVRDSVAQEVARLIRARLGEEIKLREQRQSTKNVAAWSLLQRAERLRKSGEAAPDSLTRDRNFLAADSLLAAAEQQDPKWADPVVLRGLVAYRRSRLSGRDQTVIRRWVDVGLGHVERALVLDGNNADALELRGNLRYWSYLIGLEPDANKAKALLAKAREDLEKATRTNPAQAGAWATLSHLYNQTGSGVDVNLAARRALEADAFLDNADVVLKRLFLSSYDLEQLPDARHWCDETQRRFASSSNAPECGLFMLTTRSEQPDVARAWRLADSVTKMAPAFRKQFLTLSSNMMAAAVVARAGLADSARRVVERSKGDAQISPTQDLALMGAFVYTLLGDRDKAIDLLKIYFAANERMRAAYAEEPGWWFRPLANEPKFKQLVGAT
ncbi:MAG TPA: serine/threonine-protein kinase [Thermoanaerobaculia bacterium]|nr:serine/threonine-protein kinase [Thermoanaerobaculia bacterium]